MPGFGDMLKKTNKQKRKRPSKRSNKPRTQTSSVSQSPNDRKKFQQQKRTITSKRTEFPRIYTPITLGYIQSMGLCRVVREMDRPARWSINDVNSTPHVLPFKNIQQMVIHGFIRENSSGNPMCDDIIELIQNFARVFGANVNIGSQYTRNEDDGLWYLQEQKLSFLTWHIPNETVKFSVTFRFTWENDEQRIYVSLWECNTNKFVLRVDNSEIGGLTFYKNTIFFDVHRMYGLSLITFNAQNELSYEDGDAILDVFCEMGVLPQYPLPVACHGRPYTIAHVTNTCLFGNQILTNESHKNAVCSWRVQQESEYMSIASFSKFALELSTLKAPMDLILECHVFANDEMRHANICREIVEFLAKRVGVHSTKDRLIKNEFSVSDHSLSAITLKVFLMETVLYGCIGECISACKSYVAWNEFIWNDELKRKLLGIAKDETNHFLLAWKVVFWCVGRKRWNRDTCVLFDEKWWDSLFGKYLSGCDEDKIAKKCWDGVIVRGMRSVRRIFDGGDVEKEILGIRVAFEKVVKTIF